MASVCFVDESSWDYDVTAPLTRPFGGSHSALCYLAVALARRGHRVSLVNNRAGEGEVEGVACIGRRGRATPDLLRALAPDAAVVLNGPAALSEWRFALPAPTRLVLWTQSDIDQPAMQDLARRNVRRRWDRIVSVSDWHAGRLAGIGVERERMTVLRNAVAPAFEAMFADAAALRAAKRMRAAYTSTPFRGLDLLAQAWPAIRARHPAAECAVWSGMQVYNAEDPFGALYAALDAQPGMRRNPPVSQPEVANALREVAVLAYPNSFAETSCIAVMEALAAGALVVTSALGALPETCMGLAELVPGPPPGGDRAAYLHAFADRVAAAFDRLRDDPAGFAAARFAQVQALAATHTWAARAAQWEAALEAW